MKLLLLLLLCFTGALLGKGLVLQAPLNPTMSSVNFKHEFKWTAAPDSPPGLKYHVSAKAGREDKEKITTTKLWAEVKLKHHPDSYTLKVRSSFNGSRSSWSFLGYAFTPYLHTHITAPNVTMAGCGNCIQITITLPNAIREIYRGLMLYKVSWKKKQETTVENIEEYQNTTIIIPHLLQGTEYCVQVKPYFLEVSFESSSWGCVFTSTVPKSQVFAIVGSVATLVVVSLSAMVLILFGLQYTGVLCKLKDALPHPLSTSLLQRSLLRLEKTVPEPLSLLPEKGRPQHSHWDQDEDGLETNELDHMEDQEEDQYTNRCVDLSSDSSSRCSCASSCQSAATVTTSAKSQDEGTEEQRNEQVESIKNEDWMKKQSKDCTEIEEWHKELEKYESVNLFSVITALDLQSDLEPCDAQTLEPCDAQSLAHMPYQLEFGLQQLQESDNEDQETQMNCYMRH